MRSVVVVLPASMCAMIPMLRVLASSALFAMIPSLGPTRSLASSKSVGDPKVFWMGLSGLQLPSVVGEGLVGLRHLVGVLAALDAGPEAVARIAQLVGEAL